MKKFLVAAAISSNLMAAQVVTDPGSYVHLMNTIKAINDQISIATDQLKEINKLNDMINETEKLIFESNEKLFNPATRIKNFVNNVQNIDRKLKRLANRIQETGIEQFVKNYHNSNADTKLYLEQLLRNDKDPLYKTLLEDYQKATHSGNYDSYVLASDRLNSYMKIKGVELNELKKEATYANLDALNNYLYNEDEIKEREEKVQRLADLLESIQNEIDMIKQQQITNTILMEMVEILTRQYEQSMKMDYALSLNMLVAANEINKEDVDKNKKRLEGGQRAEEGKKKTAAEMMREKAERGKERRPKNGWYETSDEMFERLGLKPI
ncbi:hypothetical protein [Wolinella succinogenes]|uniref:Uncharacterized protein n=1 Tax=Wolinella succinogenes (strain ATCC 29543 / DSM 1740 / CCUG 13145 / JCM 31913 / LMG 7466 / NCTC 11488 / FDC 602W) TaxID=273121 RepID=Q7MRR2_WOLSU|nr:hypothetical protein [Wolinella succinogenes]CAE10196.1 hypothetical protein WS1103 [Wolinella succinogenes]VEG82411.1 Uncharacterised protein [Wolinella succinogenes]